MKAWPGGIAIVAVLLGRLAHAQSPGTDVVVTASGVPAPIAARVRAELASAGFRVIDAPPSAPVDFARPNLRLHDGADGVRIVASAPTGGGDPALRTATVDTAGPEAPALIALRAVELLNASLAAATVAPPAPAAPVAPTAPTPPPRPVRLALGATAVHTPSGVGPALGPSGWVAVPLATNLDTRVWVRAPLLAPTLTGRGGIAHIRSEALGLDACGIVDVGPRLRSFAAAGLGLHRLVVNGAARDLSTLGREDNVVSAMLAAGVGAALSLTRRIALAIEGHAALLAPRPVIRSWGQELATAGRPFLGVTLGISVALDSVEGS